MNKLIKRISISVASLIFLLLGTLSVTASHISHIYAPKYSANINIFRHQRRYYHYRHLEWNTRDLGGYHAKSWKTSSARITKPHLIIRSSRLTHLNHHSKKELQKLHMRTVIDLRNSNDVAKHLDTGEHIDYHHAGHVPGTHIRYIHVPIWRNHTMSNRPAWRHYFYTRYAAKAPQAVKSYRKIFHILLHTKHAVAFHCDEGHDRTGVTAALIEGALNVKRSNELKDYELTNQYHHTKSNVSQYDNIHEFYHYIDKNYGSVHAYLIKRIGLTNRQLRKLQYKYTETD